jgi:hypothetical protein
MTEAGACPEPVERAADNLTRVRAEIRARREAMLQERIRAFHTCNRDIPVKQIASFVGVSAQYVLEVLDSS